MCGIRISGTHSNFHDNLFVDLQEQEEGGFVATCREFAGAVGQGETEEEAILDLRQAIELLKEVELENEEVCLMGQIYVGQECWEASDSTTTDTYTDYPCYPDPYYSPYWFQWRLQQSCPKCGKCIECGDRYCRHCGNQLIIPKYCPHCGKEI